MIVHILHYGLPICGFSALTPREWPKDHAWVRIEDAHQATCPLCRRGGSTVLELTAIGEADARAPTEEERAALQRYPNLLAILMGTTSGRWTEWPLIRVELRKLLRDKVST